MIQEYDDVLDSELWNTLTHLVYDGLVYTTDGGVEVGSFYAVESRGGHTGGGSKFIYDAGTYIDFLRNLKRKFPHLKIIWALPPTVPHTALSYADQGVDDRQQGPFEKMISKYGWAGIIDQVVALREILPMDGVEFNFTAQRILDGEFVKEMARLRGMSLWASPPLLYDQLNDLAA
jgi:hypothetical protein